MPCPACLPARPPACLGRCTGSKQRLIIRRLSPYAAAALPWPAPCSFLVESFEEEFATVVGLNWVIWCIVLVSLCQ